MSAGLREDRRGGGSQLQTIAAQAAALRCAAHAEAVAGEAHEAEGVRKGVDGIRLASSNSSAQPSGRSGHSQTPLSLQN